jgi:RNA polymerase sigma-70 factor (ECF subfamily)
LAAQVDKTAIAIGCSARSFDAEDATQEAMLRAWKGLDQFDERASLKNWLYRIGSTV